MSQFATITNTTGSSCTSLVASIGSFFNVIGWLLLTSFFVAKTCFFEMKIVDFLISSFLFALEILETVFVWKLTWTGLWSIFELSHFFASLRNLSILITCLLPHLTTAICDVNLTWTSLEWPYFDVAKKHIVSQLTFLNTSYDYL